MNKYQLQLTKRAEKDLERMDRWRKVALKLLDLEENPDKGHTLEGSFKGVRSLELLAPLSTKYRPKKNLLFPLR